MRERGSDKNAPRATETKRETPPPIPELPADAEKSARRPKLERTVSISVTDDVPLREILMDLGRDGEFNLEIDPRIKGGVIFTAHNQPFSKVLERLCALAGLRYSVDGDFIRIELDHPYTKTYAVDYPSLSRRSTSEVAISTNVFDVDVSAGSGGKNSSASSGGVSDNNSTAKISGESDADFWAELEKSLAKLLSASFSPAPTIGNGENPSKNSADQSPSSESHRFGFSIDRQAGMVTVSANSRQHEAAKQYLDRLKRKASAQVLIEARVVEVELSEGFQSGINWRSLFNGSVNAAANFGATGAGAPFLTPATAAEGMFTASLDNRDFAGILNLVKTFGTTRILSSPRLTVLNNQTAVLKVARNEVYFLTSAQFPTMLSHSGILVSGSPVFSSTPRTVPVGLVMTVQPAINLETGRITMTLRPTISRVVSRVEDPSIGLNAASAGVSSPVKSQIPVLAVREMDSVLQINSGEVAVLGGLMQDSSENEDKGLPMFDSLPLIGNLVKSRSNDSSTSELVILLRATIMEQAKPDEADRDLYDRYYDDPRSLKFNKPNPRS